MNGKQALARALSDRMAQASSGNTFRLSAYVTTTSPLTVRLTDAGSSFPCRPGPFSSLTVDQKIEILTGQGQPLVIDAY